MNTGAIVAIVIAAVAVLAGAIAVWYALKKRGTKPAAPIEETAKPAEVAKPVEEVAKPVEEAVEAAEEAKPAEEVVEAAEVAEETAEIAEAPAQIARETAQEEEAEEIAVAAAPAEGDVAGESLAVRDMSPALRAALGVEGKEHDAEVYSVRYSYSFLARLVLAADDVKGYYSELVDEIASYKKLRIRSGRRQQNVSLGRQRAAAILFKGKKLCLALALDPAEYAGTKYRGKDVSSMKRFAATPMLFKVDSPRKIKYAKYLLARLAENGGLTQGKVVPVKSDEVPALTRDELFAAKEIKATGKRIK